LCSSWCPRTSSRRRAAEICKLIKEKVGGIAIEVAGTFEEAFELIKEKIQDQALTLPVPVEFEKFAKLIMFVSVDVIENEDSAEVSELSKEMVGALIFRRRAMQKFSNLSWRRSEPARIARP
jgi:hypothetical protein